MREIKFRVWDNEQQEYLNTDILHIKNDGTLLISKKGENPWSALLSSGCNSERFVIEFSTGLKDKNGNEIFVNDIIEMHYFEQYAGPGEVEKTVVGVVGKDSMGCFTRVGDKKYYWLYYLEDAEYYGDAEHNEELELLGSIHENPELLEEK